MDEYEDDQDDPHSFGYGQVQFHAHVTLRAHPSFGMTRDSRCWVPLSDEWGGCNPRARLVRPKRCGINKGIRAYCVIGRVKIGNRLGIVDRYWGLQEAIMEGMVDPDYEPEDGPND